MTNHKISFIIPAYNVADFIEECLESIEKQTYFRSEKNYEVLIAIDNCPKTKAKLEQIKNTYSNIFTFWSSRNVGPYILRNSLAQKSSGEILFFFDADDIWKEDAVEIIMDVFKKPNTDIVRYQMSHFRKEKDSGKLVFTKSKPFISKGQFCIKRNSFEKIGGFQPWLCAADREFLFRHKKHKFIQRNIYAPLYLKRIHDNQLTSVFKVKKGTSRLRTSYKAQIRKATYDWSIPIYPVLTDLELLFHTPSLNHSVENIAIGIATYKRPESLSALLSSIKDQDLGVYGKSKITIYVMDNDINGSAREVVSSVQKDFPFEIVYDIEKTRGITYVRNRIVALAKASRYLIFIDDDEVAQPQWLSNLLSTAETFRASIVAGPVIRAVEGSLPRWARNNRFFRQKNLSRGDYISNTGTGNVLIRTEILSSLQGPFDNRYALVGGSDSVLFAELRKRGYRIIWAPDATAIEKVPKTRITVSWMIRRSFRIGCCSALYTRHYDRGMFRILKKVFSGFFRIVKGMLLLPLVLITVQLDYIVKMLQDIARGTGIIWGIVGLKYLEYKNTHGS